MRGLGLRLRWCFGSEKSKSKNRRGGVKSGQCWGCFFWWVELALEGLLGGVSGLRSPS